MPADSMATASAEHGATIVGERIRELRKAQRVTLEGLGQKCGLSVGYLSQVERNQATPSIKALHDIAQALGVNIGWFFPDPDHDALPEARYIVRAGRRRALKFESGVKDELLCPTLSGQLELMQCSFEPGASSGEDLYAHDGEEAGVVTSGTLELSIDGEVFLLEEGDSFHFKSDKPHRYRNPGERPTTVVWAMTPPSY